MSDSFLIVPRELTPAMREAFHESYEAYEDGSGTVPDSQWRAMLLAAPQPSKLRQERCDTCHGLGEVATGTVTHHGYNQPPEPDLEVCPECSGEQRWYVAGDIDRLVRELDVLMNGDGAAPQAKLCDLVAQVAESKKHQGEPIGYVCPRALDAAINGRIGAEQISILKTPYLYINKPIYTHPAPADPGEVERLRAQLAELDALLSKALTGLEYIQKECTGDVTPGYIGCLVDDVVDLLSASAEQNAPVERDERAEFEACIRREWPMAPISRKRDLLPKEDPCYGDYCDEPLQRAWVGWQMRAAMERKPF